MIVNWIILIAMWLAPAAIMWLATHISHRRAVKRLAKDANSPSEEVCHECPPPASAKEEI